MAETVAIELIKVVFQQLTDEALKRIIRSQGIYDELEELGSTLSRIQELLNDASEQEVSKKSVKEWLDRLQHLAYDIDDVLDDLAVEAASEQTQEPGATTSKVRKLIPACCTNFSLSNRLSSKLDNINRELAHLEKQNPGLIVKVEKPKNTSTRNETALPDASRVVGREREIEKLLNKLLRDETSKVNFCILPIVGMGGVGKTTLARLLYNHTEVKGHFELKAWVCISDVFDIFKISNTILQSVTGEHQEYTDLNLLQNALKEQFKDRRFLLVVDDVWNEKIDDWEKLVKPFLSCAHGSRIIMTTRKEQLLIDLGFGRLDRLESLPHEDAFSLFAQHALGVDNFDSHTTLKPHAEGIVKKCDGLPLALKAIGRMMKTKTDEEDWDDVLKSEIWDIENGNEIAPALRLSYHDLSADLKQLFVYCSLFPKDFLFSKKELVLLWMAEGFLNPSNATKSPERLGRDYFNDLLSRSFFQQAPNDESLFIMHDLVVDLATFVAGEFFLRFDEHKKINNKALAKHRHISFIQEDYVGYHKFEAFNAAKRLRTFLGVSVRMDKNWGNFYLSDKILVDLLPHLPLLRVLCLSCFEITEVPESIGSLKHLRYLNLSQTKIQELPENVGTLYNLQTFIVVGCRLLTKLPRSFLKLKKLRHFDIRDTPLLKKLPLGIRQLESLQTLTKVIIGGDDDLAINELKALKNLNGKFSMEGLHKVKHAMHAREAKVSLKRITELELQWSDVFDGSRMGTLEKEVLNELEPNRDKLNALEIVSYGGTEFSNWVGDPSFLELVDVSIRGCRKCTSLPPFEQLPSLKKLSIQGMDEVKVIGLELTGIAVVAFPSLEVLRLEDMLGWEVWSTNNEVLDAVFPCLRELSICSCPNLVDISLKALPLLRVLEIQECGYGVLTSLVRAASLITELTISSISGLTDEVWRNVVKYLAAVEDVTVKECNEIRYLWESEAAASKVLVKLHKLHVSRCSNLVSLGEKEEDDNFGSNLLSNLRMLDIWSCDNMERCCCPNSNSIEILGIYDCKSLTRLSFPTTTWQNLKSIVIQNCDELVENINNTRMLMIEDVAICGWRNLKSIVRLSNFLQLTSLTIQDCPGFESFPDLQLPKLTRLSIEDCENLESFPTLSNLTLLNWLLLVNCPSLDNSFFCGVWPPKLVSLGIGGLKKPISECPPLNFPTSLVTLMLHGEPHLSNVRQMSHLFPSSVITLAISSFDNLESLSMGLQHLTSLRHLYIRICPKMKRLPKMLLPSLLSLQIFGCPKLEEKCNGRGSHYWPLISHIPRIDI